MAGRFLIVEPDPPTAEVLAKLCRETRRVRIARDLADARALLHLERNLTGVISELELPDGDGLEVVEIARESGPLLPLLVLTARVDPVAINRVHALRAEYHCKPTRRAALRGFLQRAVAFERVQDVRLSWLIEDFVQRYNLTPRESDLLAAAVSGVPRRELADELGTTNNTIKTQVRTLLRKCNQHNLEELGRAVLQEGLARAHEPHLRRGSNENQPSHPPTIRPIAPQRRWVEERSGIRSGIRRRSDFEAGLEGYSKPAPD